MADPIGTAIAAATLPSDADCATVLTTCVALAVAVCRASGGALVTFDGVVAAVAGDARARPGAQVDASSAEQFGRADDALTTVALDSDGRRIGTLVLLDVPPAAGVPAAVAALAADAAASLATVAQLGSARATALGDPGLARVAVLAQAIDALPAGRRRAALDVLAAVEGLLSR